MSDMNFGSKTLTSLFQAVTTRTAGFNSVDVQHLTNSTLLIFIFLMFIGASPGSCGGGIKNTTFAVLMTSILSRFKLQEDVNIMYRKIPNATVSRVFSVVFFSIITILGFTFLILILELPEVSHTQTRGMFLEYLFEVVSAFGTVGLSTGVTPTLSIAGKITITVLMIIGRLGPLTVALVVRGRESSVKYQYMQEKIMIG
jgi:trk system potassium uptake protein TrkH